MTQTPEPDCCNTCLREFGDQEGDARYPSRKNQDFLRNKRGYCCEECQQELIDQLDDD